jgi:hypothetical protein
MVGKGNFHIVMSQAICLTFVKTVKEVGAEDENSAYNGL